MGQWRENLKNYLNYIKAFSTSIKGKYSITIFGVLIVLLLISNQLIAHQKQTPLPNTYVSPTISEITPFATTTPTNTPLIKPHVSPTIQPTVIIKATATPTPKSSSNSTNNSQSPTSTPQPTPTPIPTITPTPTPSIPTVTAQNGTEFTFQVGYTSQYGYTPPTPTYETQYVQFLWSGVTTPNYTMGDYIYEEFHFKAIKTGETTIAVNRRNVITYYHVIIH